jgi:HSP20 family molecular chaperone IbpA
MIDLPPENHRETAKSTYSKGIWEITFAKKAKSIETESKVD